MLKRDLTPVRLIAVEGMFADEVTVFAKQLAQLHGAEYVAYPDVDSRSQRAVKWTLIELAHRVIPLLEAKKNVVCDGYLLRLLAKHTGRLMQELTKEQILEACDAVEVPFADLTLIVPPSVEKYEAVVKNLSSTSSDYSSYKTYYHKALVPNSVICMPLAQYQSLTDHFVDTTGFEAYSAPLNPEYL